jgi:hypothetical protein
MSNADRGERFKNCSSSCTRGGCRSYGACLRSKGVAVTGLESTNPSFTREASKKWDSDLDAYAAARADGIQPASTKREHVDAAVEVSQQLQMPFDASAPPAVKADA